MSIEKPVFVVFEGLDGSGKSTVAKLVADALDAILMTTPSVRVREFRDDIIADFGGSQEAAQLFYLATVFAASRAADGHIAAGRSAVLDRYFLSTQAYASFRGSVLRDDDVQRHLLPADLTVFLQAPLDVRRVRVSERGGSAADRETLLPSGDSALRREYETRFDLPVVGRLLILDSATASPDELAVQVMQELDGASRRRRAGST